MLYRQLQRSQKIVLKMLHEQKKVVESEKKAEEDQRSREKMAKLRDVKNLHKEMEKLLKRKILKRSQASMVELQENMHYQQKRLSKMLQLQVIQQLILQKNQVIVKN